MAKDRRLEQEIREEQNKAEAKYQEIASKANNVSDKANRDDRLIAEKLFGLFQKDKHKEGVSYLNGFDEDKTVWERYLTASFPNTNDTKELAGTIARHNNTLSLLIKPTEKNVELINTLTKIGERQSELMNEKVAIRFDFNNEEQYTGFVKWLFRETLKKADEHALEGVKSIQASRETGKDKIVEEFESLCVNVVPEVEKAGKEWQKSLANLAKGETFAGRG